MLPARLAILKRLDQADLVALSSAAREADALEEKWRRKVNAAFREEIERVVNSIERNGRLPPLAEFDLYKLFAEQSFDVMGRSMKSAEADLEKRFGGGKKRLKKPPVTRIPRSLKGLQELWDQYRKKKYVAKRPRELAERVRKEYLKKVQDVWRKHSEDYRTGDVFTQERVVAKVREAANVARSRAKMIVETETCFYYNNVRREVYDRSSDVVAYLFVAIRDHATTKWCKSRNGLVYRRNDPRLDEETPPIHWNCRSEILPLTRQNPRHLILIEDKSLDRGAHICEPLPKGWTRRVA